METYLRRGRNAIKGDIKRRRLAAIRADVEAELAVVRKAWEEANAKAVNRKQSRAGALLCIA